MSYVFNMHEAKTKLSRLVELAEAGEEVQIARNGRPAVKLVVAEQRRRPKFGEFAPLEGWISADFDETLPEWIDSANSDPFADESRKQ
jgi:prevent-host-death family protein